MASFSMPSSEKRHIAFVAVGCVLVGLGFLGLCLRSVATGEIGWRNAWGQPVTIYLVIAGLSIVVLIGAMNHFVWRHERKRSGRR